MSRRGHHPACPRYHIPANARDANCPYESCEMPPGPEPVSYPGGVQWAIKHNFDSEPFYEKRNASRSDMEFWHRDALRRAKKKHPDNPEKWPELVSARITWEVTE